MGLLGGFLFTGEYAVQPKPTPSLTVRIGCVAKTPTPENGKSCYRVLFIYSTENHWQTSFMWQSIFLDPRSTVGRQIVYMTIRPEGNCRRSIHPDALSKLITHRRYPRMVPTKTAHGNMEKLPSVLRTWTKNRAKSPPSGAQICCRSATRLVSSGIDTHRQYG